MPGVRFPVTEFEFCFEKRGTRDRRGRLSHRGIGAIGSVRASQARGTGIETQILQHPYGLVGYDARLTRERSRVRASVWISGTALSHLPRR